MALTQAGTTDYDGDLLIPLMPIVNYTDVGSADDVSKRADHLGMKVTNLDDYMELAKKGVEKWKSEGAVGLKMASTPNVEKLPPSKKIAEEAFSKIISSAGENVDKPSFDQLQNFMTNYLIDVAGELDMVIAQEEIFGPVAYIIPFETEAEGVELANATQYGLANSVWTSDPDRAASVAESLVAGNSWINAHNVFVHGVPYGGVNLSGLGGGVLGPDTYFDYLRQQSVVRPL